MRSGRLLPLLAATGALLLAAPAAASAGCPGSELEADQLPAPQIETTVLCLVNERRAQAGLDAVAPEARLRRAAERHSLDMVGQGFFAHTSPAGDSFIDRISATGYMRGTRSWLVGENLVWGTGSFGTPQSMVAAWMNSPPHRENLLRPRFRDVGIAAVSGTPVEAGDPRGITVSSEYGYREAGRKAGKSRKAKRAARAKRARAKRAEQARRARHRR